MSSVQLVSNRNSILDVQDLFLLGSFIVALIDCHEKLLFVNCLFFSVEKTFADTISMLIPL